MSPWAPSARNCCSRSGACGIASGRVTPTTSKPWSRAARASAAFSAAGSLRSRGRRRSPTAGCPPASRQERTERRTRLHPRVPGLRGLVFVPWHVAQIVGRRQMRGRGEIGIAHALARRASRACAPASRYRPDDSACCGAPHGSTSVSGEPPPALTGIWRLYRRSMVSGPADLGEELVVEPAHQPPDLDPRPGLARQQPLLAQLDAPGLVEIFGDDRRARNRGMAFLHQDRRGAGGVEHEEFLAALPHPLLDRAHGDAVLAERQAHEARMRAERVMEQRQHAALGTIAANWWRKSLMTSQRQSRSAWSEAPDTLGCAGRLWIERRRSNLCNVRPSPLLRG